MSRGGGRRQRDSLRGFGVGGVMNKGGGDGQPSPAIVGGTFREEEIQDEEEGGGGEGGGEGITARRSVPGSGRSGRLTGPRMPAFGLDRRQSGRALESRILSHLKDRERGGTTTPESRETDGWRQTG